MIKEQAEKLDTDQHGWRAGPNRHWLTTEIDVVVDQSHASEWKTLKDLYVKAGRSQWDPDQDVDWSYELDPENPLSMPDASIAIAGTDLWPRLSSKEKAALRREMQGWHISQILHGEKASQLCAAKLMLSSDSSAVKDCAAIQAVDEARHIEVFSRLQSKIGTSYPLSKSLGRLLYDVLEDSDPDITALGMQILIEGLALSFFKSLQLYSSEPLVKKLLALVIRDEARHFAGGQIALAERHRELDSRELSRREEFVVQSFSLLQDYLFADEIWEPAGLPKNKCSELVRNSESAATMQRVLFRQLVPAVRTIGLLGDKTKQAFEKMKILDYAALPAFDVG
ncbi:MAG: ferritin-like domain-containing protein [Parvularculaceae bacterium]